MAPLPEPILSVRNLQTHFFTDEGIVKAVDGVSFDVGAGQTLGVVGESGCGKTITALSVLRIVERPGRIVAGEILLRGVGGDRLTSAIDLAALDANGPAMRAVRGRDIALIFQEPMTSLSPVHTIGHQMIETICLHRPINKRQARKMAVELLRQVGVSRANDRLDEYSFQLSGGLRQRAMIAIALSCDPRLLIADEPTTALDVTVQAQILDLLRDVQQQRGMALMLITHSMGVIAEMADDVMVMYLGRIVEKGPVDAIFHNPKHPYTRALLRSIPSIQSKPRVRVPTISGSIPHPFNRPQGCAFHPRCPDFMAGTCDRQEPTLRPVDVEGNQEASCFLYR